MSTSKLTASVTKTDTGATLSIIPQFTDTDDVSQEIHQIFTLPASSVDVPVSFGLLTTPTFLVLRVISGSSASVSCKLNGSAVALQVSSSLIMTGTSITGITLSNAGTGDAVVEVYLAQ